MKWCRSLSAVLLFVFFALSFLHAQDPRTVNEPVFPPTCTKLTALLSAGSTPGTLSSETQLDTTRIQSAMSACPAGQAVELATDGGSNNAYLIGQLSMVKGVTLIVDAGVTVFVSRNPKDFDTGSNYCGTIQSGSSYCNPVITANRADGAGIMGYGTIDGRGNMQMLNGSGLTWWDLARNADNAGLNQNNPRLLNVTNTDRFTLYKIRFINSPKVHVGLNTDTNFTAWDVKVTAPFDARNSDGIDPGYSTNVTINKSFISVGDDQIAVGGDKSPGAQYLSITNNYLGNGHGVSIGSYTSFGVNRMLVNNIAISGRPDDGNATAVHVKSDVSRGGLVQHIAYGNICTQDVRYPLWFDPFYSGKNTVGNSLPYYKNILIQNLHAVQNLNPANGGIQYHQVLIEGYSPAVATDVTLSNVVVDDVSTAPISSNSDFLTKYGDYTPQNAKVTLGPDPVNFSSLLGELNLTQQNVTLTNNILTSAAPYSCVDGAPPAYSVFSPIGGELISGPQQVSSGSNVTVQAEIFTAKDIAYADYLTALSTDPTAGLALTAPTGTVTIYDGTAQVGQATLAATGKSGMELLSIPLAPLSSGLHQLTASYSGDSNYSAITFGNYNLVVGGGTAASTSMSVSPLSPVAGYQTTFAASVTGSIPIGTVTFSTGSLNIGTAPVVNGVATLTTSSMTGATYSVIAAYSGDAINNSSTSSPVSVTVSQDTPSVAVTAVPQNVAPNQSVTLTAQVSVNSSNSLLPSGTVKFMDGATVLGTASVADGLATFTSTFAAGTHSITATYNGDVDFAASTSPGFSLTATVIPSAITLSCTSVAYDGNQHACTGAATGSDGNTVAGTLSLTYSGSTTTPSAAGTYQVSATFTSSNPVYGNSSTSGSITIAPATPVVTVTCPSPTYDGNSHACTAAATGVGGATVSGTMALTYNGVATAPSATGTYTVAANFTSTSTNYTHASGNGSLTIAVAPTVPLPVITSLAPPLAPANSPAFTLTVNGTNFVSGSVVSWNGAPRSTTFVSSTKLTAAITYMDLASVGTAEVTVFNPAPGGGTASATFAIDSASGTVNAVTVTPVNPALIVTRGQPTPLQVNVADANSTATLSAICANIPAGVACGAYNSSNKSVLVTASSATVPGTYQIVVMFGATQQMGASVRSRGSLAKWSGLIGVSFGMLWFGGMNKKTVLRRLLPVFFVVSLLFSLSGCGGSASTVTPPTTVTSQSSVAITLTIN